MNFSTLSFLAQPVFVICLYAILSLIAVWVLYTRFTFAKRDQVPQKIAYYVAGEGFGIGFAMVVARVAHCGFWQEFWFEFVLAWFVGWLFFRYPAVRHSGKGQGTLWYSVRVEFASTSASMAGVGAVIGAIMPHVVGERPPPSTFAFWGFAAFALLMGFVVAWPMNRLLAAAHRKSPPQGGSEERPTTVKRLTLVGGTAVYGMVVWLAFGASTGARMWTNSDLMPTLGAPWSETRLRTGLDVNAALALARLESGDRSAAVAALDAGAILSEIIDGNARTQCSQATSAWFREAELRLQRGNPDAAKALLSGPRPGSKNCSLWPDKRQKNAVDLSKYVGATVVDTYGATVGEVAAVQRNAAVVDLGGLHDMFGFIDYGVKRRVVIRSEALVLGPATHVGVRYVAAPGLNPRMIRACSDPNNLPFSNDRGEGFENKLAELVAHELKARLSYVWWPERRGFLRNTLNAHRCDIVMGLPTGSERVLTTIPIYRSGYVMIARASGPNIRSLDDPKLHSLRIGVPLVGDDGANPPPVEALVRRKLGNNLHGYLVYGDYAKESPPSDLVQAVSHGKVDVAVAWGPLAGYYALKSDPPLNVALLDPSEAPDKMPFSFQISMAVRRGDRELLGELDQFIADHKAEIQELLVRFGVPQI